MNDEQWMVVRPILERVGKPGRPLRYAFAQYFNGCLYATRAGYSWRSLPAKRRVSTMDGDVPSLSALVRNRSTRKANALPESGLLIDTHGHTHAANLSDA